MKKVLLVTFSDNADHQDICFGMFESIYNTKKSDCDIWVMATKFPKVSVQDTPNTYLVDCPRKPGIEKQTFSINKLYKIIKWINKQKFDVIFFETLHVWNLAIMLCFHRKVNIYQMIHDLIPHKGDKQEKNVYLMNKVVCKLADYIVLCNKKYAPKVTEIYGVPETRVKCVDMWRRFPEYMEPVYSKRVLFFGRMNPYKGIDNLYEIVKMCPEIEFNAVGRVDPEVQEQVKKLKKLPNITMKDGYVTEKEMEQAFVNADWVILPYNSATQSGVIIDAYRYGLPCLAFDVGAIKEQIEEGVSGYLIPAENNVAFAEKLKEVIRIDNEEYKKISNAAYRYGVKKYSAEGAINRFLNVIS